MASPRAPRTGGASAPRSSARRRPALILVGLYGAGLAAVLLWPSGGAIRGLQIRSWWWIRTHTGYHNEFTPEIWSLIVNAALLVPFVAAVVLLLPRIRWWILAAGGVGIGVLAELFQELFLPARGGGSVADATANACGALLGALLGGVLRRRRPAVAPPER